MELIFEIRDAEEGGYCARALGHAIFTERKPGKNCVPTFLRHIAALRRQPGASSAGATALCEGRIDSGGVGVQLKRHEYVWRQPEVPEIETRSEDADHQMRIATQRNGLTDNLRIGCKAAAPKAVTEHHH